MQARIEFTVKLPIQIEQKHRMYLASCPVLDVFSQGETEERAKENIIEALYLFLRSCFERGTLDAVLRQCGFTEVVDQDAEDLQKLNETQYVDVPLYLLSRFEGNSHCRAV